MRVFVDRYEVLVEPSSDLGMRLLISGMTSPVLLILPPEIDRRGNLFVPLARRLHLNNIPLLQGAHVHGETVFLSSTMGPNSARKSTTVVIIFARFS